MVWFADRVVAGSFGGRVVAGPHWRVDEAGSQERVKSEVFNWRVRGAHDGVPV